MAILDTGLNLRAAEPLSNPSAERPCKIVHRVYLRTFLQPNGCSLTEWPPCLKPARLEPMLAAPVGRLRHEFERIGGKHYGTVATQMATT
jgi:hypothetical protein